MERRQALPDELLLRVQKPARYLGNEINAVYKEDWDFRVKKSARSAVRFAMCFPDVYEIGMSHLGIQILYELFNRREDTWCERVFSPWTDMDRLLREEKIPLFALESQDPLRDFDFLGFTLQFELCYTNILQVLDLAGIPLDATDRTEEDPIVIGGGPCACNPEPLARFFDLFYIGDGETSYDALLDLYRCVKTGAHGWSREEFLRGAAQIPGIYVPSLYEVTYTADGTIASFSPKNKAGCSSGGKTCPETQKAQEGVRADGREIPARVRRQVAADLDDPARAPYPVRPLIPFLTVTQDRVAVELQRGCIRGCRFCQAGMIYRPNRERDLSTVKRYADEMLRNTGQDDILLSSLSSSDYSCIREIVEHISEHYEADRVKLQVPSLRIDSFSLDLMAKVQDVRRGSLTFAPEAGSQRLRDVINKGLSEEDILSGAREAFRGGWNKVKLYFMLGLPTETEADRTAISDLANKISAAYYEEVPKEKRNGRCQITVSTSFFVPKPFTPFQWARMYRPGDYLGFSATVNHAIYEARNHRSILYSWHEADGSYLEGVLARGDRRVADLILEAYRLGALFDCWIETWNYARWEQAAANTGIDMDFYTVRERNKDEIFPWDFIDAGVRRDFLWREWEKAHAGVLTPNCREACSGCGAAEYGCGVCLRGADGIPPEPGAGSLPDVESGGKEGVLTYPSEKTGNMPEKGIAGTMRSQQSEGMRETAAAQAAETARDAGEARAEGAGKEKPELREQPADRWKCREPGAEGAGKEELVLREQPADCWKCREPGAEGAGKEELVLREQPADRWKCREPGAEGAGEEELCYKVRMRLAKRGTMKFVGHLELMRFLQKCIRRAGIPIRYSDGVTPRMIMSTAMPLGLGHESSGEYVDMELASRVTTRQALEKLRPLMPEGLEILDFRQLGDPVPAGGGGEGKKKPQKAMSIVAAAEYEVRFRGTYRRSGLLPPDWRQILRDFVAQDTIPWTKETKRGFRTLDMKPLIYGIYIEDGVSDPENTVAAGCKTLDGRSAEGAVSGRRKELYRTHSCSSPCAPLSFEAVSGRQKELYGTASGEKDPRIFMCVCSRVGENLRPEQLIGEAFRRKGYELPEDALRIFRLDLLAENPDREEIPDTKGKPAAAGRVLAAEKPDRAEIPDSKEEPDAAGRVDTTEKPDREEIPDTKEKPDAAGLAHTAEKPDRTENPGREKAAPDSSLKKRFISLGETGRVVTGEV